MIRARRLGKRQVELLEAMRGGARLLWKGRGVGELHGLYDGHPWCQSIWGGPLPGLRTKGLIADVGESEWVMTELGAEILAENKGT